MKKLSEVFAENLKVHRKKVHLTQRMLGEQLNYSEKAISKWESGTSIPPVETLIRLAELLCTDINTLLEYKLKPKYYLGIDGGATKTMFALSDVTGKVVRTSCIGPCNPVDIGFEAAEQLLSEGIRSVCYGIPCIEIALFAGISGGNTGNNAEILYEFFRRFRFSSAAVGNDAENIISAGLGSDDGIAVIMGTGCVAFTQIKGKLKQYGGFGYLFDNGGDGYNIGRDAIHAALYDETGGGRHTRITEILAGLTGGSANDKLTEFYSGGKRYIASFAKAVFAAYDAGDAVAHEILSKNMAEIANLIDAALSDFSGEARPVKVIFVGGLTARSDILFGLIEEHLKNKGAVSLSVYPYEPVLGALKLAGAPVDTGFDNGIKR